MRYTLEAANRIGPRLIFVYVVSISLFYVGNFAWRILGFLSIRKNKYQLKIPLLLTLLLSSLFPLFFIQKGTSWNTIQFLYYSLFIGNIFLTVFLIKSSSKLIKYLIFPLIIITSLIAAYENLQRYLSNPAPASVSKQEVEGLNFLKSQPRGIVLTYPYDKYLKKGLSTPVPIYAYETTAYVSAFSKQITFLEDEMNLDITGFDWQSRRDEEEKFFVSSDEFFARGFLVNNQIDYIYLVNNQNFTLTESQLQIEKIFDNGQVRIYKVQR
ncbi:MAG: hypothetical protein EOM23_00605 [Candidatus Moranbacteria bacterium]|nr:hypothetical protein [Candidatus Moranbacteria bacterium]